MHGDERQIRKLLRSLLATEPVEIDCDEVLTRIGAFLEARRGEATLPPELGAVAQHLEVCPECKEEFEALLRTFDERD